MNKDESLDPLLRRAARVDDEVRPAGPCLDAETLSAWAEGTLSVADRQAAEAHAADCERCLMMVGAMATTAPPPSGASEQPTWSPIRWLLPFATAAIALTAWLVVRPAESPVSPAAPAEQVAEVATPAAAAPPAAQQGREQDEARPRPKREQAAETPRAADTAKSTPSSKSKPASPPAAIAPMAEAVQERQDARVQMFARSAQLSGLILSPDPTVRWRLAGGTVARSTDGGATWQPQPTGIDTELIAGASPAPDVAWIVGRAGTVLLSTDGATWQRLDFPDATVDLVSIAARDASSATVTSSTGRTYTTTDGGRTWTLQEDPATPF